ncbi:hypothetical protein EDB81DRAFT_902710 [Dactylonectria macrodidyma]|uniref:Nephrocystin 3-like N-terminal domain-containing protein n=1 Tax=Dactylonectria macrodidyma TaxID=307937 RepID=A0A9P9IWX0_9HYPO|nr:hypothetical protein EDB81DRAFT_902710 [Dactylonectria macrodidyma]
MADPLSIINATVQFLVKSAKIIQVGKKIYDKVRGAPGRTEAWHSELEALQGLVKGVQESPLLKADDKTVASVRTCAAVSRELCAIFDRFDFSKKDWLGWRTWRAIGGVVIKESEIRDLFTRLERLKSTLALQIDLVNSSQTGSLLWISGPPGKGKTFISVFLSEHLVKQASQTDGPTAISFFCDNKVSSRNTATGILRGLMYQLIQQHPHFVSLILPRWKVQQDDLFASTSFEILWTLFWQMISQLKTSLIYCVLDGLDECDEPTLQRFLRKLTGKFRKDEFEKHCLKVVVLSREHPVCLPSTLASFPHITLDSGRGEIHRGTGEADRGREGHRGDASYQAHRKHLPGAVGGYILVGELHVQGSPNEVGARDRSIAEPLSCGLDAIYERILLQIRPIDQSDVANLLTWITLAPNLMTISQLCDALQIQPMTYSSREKICESYVKSCGTLIYMPHRQSDPPVTFVHQSAKDFMLSTAGTAALKLYSVERREGRAKIAHRLTRYLSEGCLDDATQSRAAKFPLRSYAIAQWDFHMAQSEEIGLQVVSKNLKFFAVRSKIRDQWLYCRLPVLEMLGELQDSPLLFTACRFGLYALTEHLLDRNCIPGVPTSSINVNEEIVAQRHACVCRVATHLHAACQAAVKGDETIFNILACTENGRWIIEREAAGRPVCDDQGYNLLIQAVRSGNEEFCSELIEKYHFDHNFRTMEFNDAALDFAVLCGYTSLAKRLVERHHATTNDPHRLLRYAFSATETGRGWRYSDARVSGWTPSTYFI